MGRGELMSLFNLSVKHGRTLDEARARLDTAVDEVRARFGPMVREVEWPTVAMRSRSWATGSPIDLRVDAQEGTPRGTSGFRRLFGDSLTTRLTQIVEQTFQKRLP